MKVATTEQLDRISQEGRDRGYNRVFTPGSGGYELDPDGIHVLDDVMLHEHAGGRRVPAHVRCWLIAKMTDAELPLTGVIDVSIERWDELPTVQSVLEQMADAQALAERYPKPPA